MDIFDIAFPAFFKSAIHKLGHVLIIALHHCSSSRQKYQFRLGALQGQNLVLEIWAGIL